MLSSSNIQFGPTGPIQETRNNILVLDPQGPWCRSSRFFAKSPGTRPPAPVTMPISCGHTDTQVILRVPLKGSIGFLKKGFIGFRASGFGSGFRVWGVGLGFGFGV